MQRIRAKWRPTLAMVLGGALAGTLGLSLAGLVALRYLDPEIGFRNAAMLVAAIIGAATLVLALMLVRLLLRPIRALAARATDLQRDPMQRAEPLDHYGTRELRHLGQSVLAMAARLQNREAAIRSHTDHVTHELKSPVAAIRAAAELLSDAPDLAAGDRHLVTEILAATGQLQTQLAALRSATAAREPMHHGQTRLAELTEALASLAPPLRLEVTGEWIDMPLGRDGMLIVLAQLLGNAAAHGATVVRLTAVAKAGVTLLTVADNGTGVSEGNRDRIFQPFFTTRREGGGSGMGLTIAANLLQAHDAEITLAESEKGTAFRITFPTGDGPGGGHWWSRGGSNP